MSTKESKFESVLASLDKKFGKGTIILGETVAEDIEVVDTGSLLLNRALGIGGWPVGRIIELYGNPSAGKSTLSLHAIANFQKKYPHKKVLLMDYEGSLDKKYARNLGVDVDNLLISQPGTQEDGYNIMIELIDTGEVSLVVLDSHTAMIPKVIVEGDVGQHTIGLQARVNSVSLGKLSPKLKDNDCTLMAISQMRTNIGVMYGDPNVSTSGKSWGFYSSVRCKIGRGVDKEGQQDKTTVEVVKNKLAAPYGKAQFNIGWGTGINRIGEVYDLAVEKGLFVLSGAWVTIPEVEGKIQGKSKVLEFLADNPEYMLTIEKQLFV